MIVFIWKKWQMIGHPKLDFIHRVWSWIKIAIRDPEWVRNFFNTLCFHYGDTQTESFIVCLKWFPTTVHRFWKSTGTLPDLECCIESILLLIDEWIWFQGSSACSTWTSPNRWIRCWGFKWLWVTNCCYTIDIGCIKCCSKDTDACQAMCLSKWKCSHILSVSLNNIVDILFNAVK